jgi:hypothetical protein
MKHFWLLLITIFLLHKGVFAQKEAEETLIKQTINQLFDGMRKSDSTLLLSGFTNNAVLQTITKNKSGKVIVRTEELSNFVKSITMPHAEVYDERIVFTKILIDDNLASVWTDYKFYVGDKFSHCGVNSFQLVKVDNSWKIVYLIDTRRKDNCN